MTEYSKHGVNLSAGQKTKISSNYKKGYPVSIRISNKDLDGNDFLALTKTQLNQITKAKKDKNGVQLNLSVSQLQHMEKTGGFLPLLLAAIPAILGGIGALSGGIASAVSSKKSNDEQKRHNEVIENQLKSGTGVISDVVGKVPVFGSFLQPLLQKIGLGNKDINKIMKGSCICKEGFRVKQIGSGLFLEPAEGGGLFLGPWKE